MAVTDQYARFVDRVWTRLAERTGHEVFYLDARSIAAYCPVCLEGTLRIQFVDAPDGPEVIITSNRGATVGACNLGCPAEQIRRALA